MSPAEARTRLLHAEVRGLTTLAHAAARAYLAACERYAEGQGTAADVERARLHEAAIRTDLAALLERIEEARALGQPTVAVVVPLRRA